MEETTNKVFVVIDNSNLLHQGQKAVPKLLNMNCKEITDLSFDYNRLVECILDGRELGGKAVLVTSTPSPLCEVWKKLDGEKFNWMDFPRPGFSSLRTAALMISYVFYTKPFQSIIVSL